MGMNVIRQRALYFFLMIFVHPSLCQTLFIEGVSVSIGDSETATLSKLRDRTKTEWVSSDVLSVRPLLNNSSWAMSIGFYEGSVLSASITHHCTNEKDFACINEILADKILRGQHEEEEEEIVIGKMKFNRKTTKREISPSKIIAERSHSIPGIHDTSISLKLRDGRFIRIKTVMSGTQSKYAGITEEINSEH